MQPQNEDVVINKEDVEMRNVGKEDIKEKSKLHQITPLSKYLAMALFIILPFLGAYIGYVNAPEKVVEVENISLDNSIKSELHSQISKEGYLTEENMPPPIEFDPASLDTGFDEIIKLDVGAVLFPVSNELELDVSGGWDVEKNIEMNGSTKITKYFFYDSEEKMVFELSYPIREIGYEFSIPKNKRILSTEAGIELDVVDRVVNDDLSNGFVHYVWWGEDYEQDSFEIFVPFSDDLYPRTNMESYDGGVETMYKSYKDYLSRQESSSVRMDEIIAEISKSNSAKEEHSGYNPENSKYMIESGIVTVYEAEEKIVAELWFGLGPSETVTTAFNSKDTVFDDVLTAIKKQAKDADYVDLNRVQVIYAN